MLLLVLLLCLPHKKGLFVWDALEDAVDTLGCEWLSGLARVRRVFLVALLVPLNLKCKRVALDTFDLGIWEEKNKS